MKKIATVFVLVVLAFLFSTTAQATIVNVTLQLDGGAVVNMGSGTDDFSFIKQTLSDGADTLTVSENVETLFNTGTSLLIDNDTLSVRKTLGSGTSTLVITDTYSGLNVGGLKGLLTGMNGGFTVHGTVTESTTWTLYQSGDTSTALATITLAGGTTAVSASSLFSIPAGLSTGTVFDIVETMTITLTGANSSISMDNATGVDVAPEPSSLLLLGFGLAGLGGYRLRKKTTR